MPLPIQRKPKILLIDNYDSFTYNLWDYISILGAEVNVVRTESITDSHFSGVNGVILSPGPGNPNSLPDLRKIVQFVLPRFPVLGVCLGFQAIALHFGCEVIKGNPTHGKISKVFKVNNGRLISDIPIGFEVVRYHSLIVRELKEPLISLLTTQSNEIMAFEHNQAPIFGIQYHPEAHLTQFGFEILKNWLSFC